MHSSGKNSCIRFPLVRVSQAPNETFYRADITADTPLETESLPLKELIHINYWNWKIIIVTFWECALIIGNNVGILLLNKDMSAFTSNTLLIPKRSNKTMRGKVKMKIWNEISNDIIIVWGKNWT